MRIVYEYRSEKRPKRWLEWEDHRRRPRRQAHISTQHALKDQREGEVKD